MEGRRGSARLLLGLGVPPGSRACATMLARMNGAEGFFATDISDMDLAQVRSLAYSLSTLSETSIMQLWTRSLTRPAYTLS